MANLLQSWYQMLLSYIQLVYNMDTDIIFDIAIMQRQLHRSLLNLMITRKTQPAQTLEKHGYIPPGRDRWINIESTLNQPIYVDSMLIQCNLPAGIVVSAPSVKRAIQVRAWHVRVFFWKVEFYKYVINLSCHCPPLAHQRPNNIYHNCWNWH